MLDIKGWVIMAGVSAILFGLGDFIVVYSDTKKMDVVTLYVTYTILIGLLNLIYLLIKRDGVKTIMGFGGGDWKIVVGLCVTYFAAYLLHFIAIQRASNPGYANALVMFHVVVLTLLSYYLLAKPLNAKAVIGMVLIFIGSGLVTLYS